MTTPKKGPWTILSAKDVYENPWIRLTHHEVLTPAQTPGIYGLVHYKNLAIGVMPVDAEGHTYLVGQYRFPLDAYSWEIPEGGGAAGIDPLESAARELREETGLTARHWRKLLEADLSNSVSDERAVAYVAWGLTPGESEPEATEELARSAGRGVPHGRGRRDPRCAERAVAAGRPPSADRGEARPVGVSGLSRSGKLLPMVQGE